jgi:hypothetical protein
MQSRVRADMAASAAKQLAVEIDWLAGELPGSFLRPPPLSPTQREIVQFVTKILRHPNLVPFLSILEHHNSTPRWQLGRRTPTKTRFLLGPHLYQVHSSVRARDETRRRLPVLDQPAAEIRAHFRTVAGECKTLAELLRKGPQPLVALASETRTNELLKVLNPLTELFEASDDSERQHIPFTELLERAARWFDELAAQIPRAKQNKQTAKGELRFRAVEFLVSVFRKRLNHPYHAHVASIATILSGIETNADFVKKVDARQTTSSDSD